MKRLAVFLIIFGLFFFTYAAAFAQEIHSSHIGTKSECAATWHFVHNQIKDAERGILTVEFKNAGVVIVSANKVLPRVQHYDVILNFPDTLTGAYDQIPGGKLLLSSVSCTETPPTTTTTVPSTTTTTVPSTTTTTTTTVPSTTTTTVPPTTTTTTTTVPSTTTTTVPSTTTTTIPDSDIPIEELPNTGIADMVRILISGLFLIAIGSILLFLSRNKVV